MVSAPRLYFDSVHIIESLRPDDLHTGRQLYEDLAPLTDASTPPVTAHFHAVQSRAAFLEKLRSIAADARLHSHSPILHIEAHGHFTGIDVTSGEYLPWREFEDELIAINEISRLNLLVMLAACQGAHLFKVMVAHVGDRAPMRMLIGPKGKIYPSEIEHAYPAFYRALFDTGDIGAAWRAMNDAVALGSQTFQVFTAEHTFRTLMYGYFTTYCSEDALTRRENRAVALLKQEGRSEEDLEQDRQVIRGNLRDHRRHFQKFKKCFFFCDLYPENATRFGVTFEDCQRDPSET